MNLYEVPAHQQEERIAGPIPFGFGYGRPPGFGFGRPGFGRPFGYGPFGFGGPFFPYGYGFNPFFGGYRPVFYF